MKRVSRKPHLRAQSGWTPLWHIRDYQKDEGGMIEVYRSKEEAKEDGANGWNCELVKVKMKFIRIPKPSPKKRD